MSNDRITEDEVKNEVDEKDEAVHVSGDKMQEETSSESEPTAPPASVQKRKAGRPPKAKADEKDEDGEVEETSDKLETSEEVPTSKKLMDSEVFKQYNDQAKALEKVFAKQTQVQVIVPFLPGEKAGAVHECGINGVFMGIPKGRMITVPQSVAQLLADHFNLTYEVGKEFEIGRAGDVQDALASR